MKAVLNRLVMNRAGSVLAAASWMAVAGSAHAQLPAFEPLRGMTVVKTDAGTLDSSGWTDAVSGDGRFAARFPCLYNDYRMEGTPGTRAVGGSILVCSRADQTQFSVMRAEMTDPVKARQEFERMSAMQPSLGPPMELTFQGLEARQLEENADGRCGWTRFILDGRNVMTILVENWGGNCAVIAPDVRIFFDSLKVTAA